VVKSFKSYVILILAPVSTINILVLGRNVTGKLPSWDVNKPNVLL